MSEQNYSQIPISMELVDAVFNIDVDRFKTLIESQKFDVRLLDNICGGEGGYCPIQWIIQCWEIILNTPDTWREDCRGER